MVRVRSTSRAIARLLSTASTLSVASDFTSVREIFRTLGKTVVFVTHDLAEAGFIGDTVVLLRDGRVVQQGALADLVRAPADEFVTKFVNAQRSPLEGVG